METLTETLTQLNNIENITIVTSVLDCKAFSVYNRDERFLQTKKTLNTVKEKIKNNFIILIEKTKLTEDELNYFYSNCNIIINEYENKEFVNNINHPNKSFGERCYLLKCIDYINNNKELFSKVKNIFKVSGRYFLDDKFDYINYDNDKNVVKIVDEKIWANACTTCLFKISINELDNFYNSLLNKFDINNCMEQFFYIYIKSIDKSRYIDLETLGMSGFVANGGFGSC